MFGPLFVHCVWLNFICRSERTLMVHWFHFRNSKAPKSANEITIITSCWNACVGTTTELRFVHLCEKRRLTTYVEYKRFSPIFLQCNLSEFVCSRTLISQSHWWKKKKEEIRWQRTRPDSSQSRNKLVGVVRYCSAPSDSVRIQSSVVSCCGRSYYGIWWSQQVTKGRKITDHCPRTYNSIVFTQVASIISAADYKEIEISSINSVIVHRALAAIAVISAAASKFMCRISPDTLVHSFPCQSPEYK